MVPLNMCANGGIPNMFVIQHLCIVAHPLAGTVRQGYKGFLGPVWLMHEPMDSLQRDNAGQGSIPSHHWAPSPGLWMPRLLSKYLDIGKVNKRHVNRFVIL